MNDARIIKELSMQESKFEADLRSHCSSLVDMSYNFMSTNYHDQWLKNMDAYRSKRTMDEQDRKAVKRKEPRKMVFPLTFSHVDTFVSFCYALFTQKDRFYELVATGAEDELAKLIAESVLERDLQHSNWYGDKLSQFLKDVALCNLGVIKHNWAHETEPSEQVVTNEMTGAQEIQEIDEVKFQGNKLYCVNPFRFFPDPRVPVTRFQEGEFVADVNEYSRHTLQRMAARGVIVGFEFVQKMSQNTFDKKWLSMTFDEYVGYYNVNWHGVNPPFALTEVQINLVPSEWLLEDGKPLGEETEPVKYVVWLLNDQRIVRIMPLAYPHNEFTYDVAVYDYDQNLFLGISLAELIDEIQNTATWFVNSRITSVRKVIDNRLIVDPKGIEMDDLKKRSPIVRIKPNFAGFGVQNLVTQLNVVDVTQSHLQDVAFLENAAARATGITENLMGMFATGRRSASEARAVNSNAAARLKRVAAGIWNNGLRQLGHKLLVNLRSGMDAQQLIRVVGEVKFLENLPGITQFMAVDKSNFDTAFDFQIFDGTLPSEKNMMAEGLSEMLQVLIGQPQLAQMFEINLRELFFEYLRMKGIRNVERFRLPQGTVAEGGAMGAASSDPAAIQSLLGLRGDGAFGVSESGVGGLIESPSQGTDDGRATNSPEG